jgi:transcriptional regulator with PAS, ATPase and Fis domain
MDGRIQIDVPIETPLKQIEIAIIAQVVEKLDGNPMKAAVTLGVSLPTIYRALAKLKAREA